MSILLPIFLLAQKPLIHQFSLVGKLDVQISCLLLLNLETSTLLILLIPMFFFMTMVSGPTLVYLD